MLGSTGFCSTYSVAISHWFDLVYIYIYIHIEIARRAVQQASARSAGRPASAAWAPLLARSGLDWLDLAAPGAPGSPWLARSGFDWLDLAALGAQLERPGRPATCWLARSGCQRSLWAPSNAWLARSACQRKPQRLAFRLSASMLPASCALERLLMPQI